MRACFPAAAGVTLMAALGAAATPGPTPGVPVSVKVADSVIRVTPRYEGELVPVAGTAPRGCDVVVTLTSGRTTVYGARKGKVGAFWLSVGRVRFDGVPQMYEVRSTAPLDEIVDAADQVKYVLGLRGLKASLAAQADTGRDLYVDELILIRRRGRLFSFREGAVERQGETFRTTLYWPPGGPPGRYVVDAYAVSAGKVVGSAATAVDVRVVGVEAWVRDLARKHGVLYGLFAVGLAVVAGLAASLAFKVRAFCGQTAPPED